MSEITVGRGNAEFMLAEAAQAASETRSCMATDHMTPGENKRLIEKFPFLLPRNRFTDQVAADYDYSYTELDAMPGGWRKAFGEQMCQEICDELAANNLLDSYRIMQIKEKFGRLRWYDNGCTPKMLHEIIPKYARLSWHTCIQCGAPTTKRTTGWIAPYCDKCAPEGAVLLEDNE